MTFLTETIPDAWTWWRIADASWADPLDPDYARRNGARWNPPDSFPTLYLNEDQVTARLNLQLFIADWPYEPEDLRPENGPELVGATLPRKQTVCDVHTTEGVAAAGLPRTYPLDSRQRTVAHARCQPIGHQAWQQGLRGVRARSAQAPHGAGRELAWFPASSRSKARRVEGLRFDRWFWG